jgi:hypothetical protein
VRLYHRTDRAAAIREGGFRDAGGSYGTSRIHRGVWVADSPLNVNEGVEGDAVLVIEAPASAIAPFEWIEEGKGYREFLVPADELNRYPIIVVLDDPIA